MARPLNKQQLLEFAEHEYQRLLDLVNQLKTEQRDTKCVFANRTTKDIVSHLYAWQLLILGWYAEGLKGKKPPGYSFKDTPALNEKLFQDHKDIIWDELKAELYDTHTALVKIIEHHTNEELFMKKKYIWTGSTDMAVYLRSALSSHYVWAIDLIRKYF